LKVNPVVVNRSLVSLPGLFPVVAFHHAPQLDLAWRHGDCRRQLSINQNLLDPFTLTRRATAFGVLGFLKILARVEFLEDDDLLVVPVTVSPFVKSTDDLVIAIGCGRFNDERPGEAIENVKGSRSMLMGMVPVRARRLPGAPSFQF
jgi:hypothetical protein